MTADLSAEEMSVNLHIDGSNEVISLRQAKWLISQVKEENCTPSCLSCHFNRKYLRELEPEVIESLLANEFQVTNQVSQGGELVVGSVNNRSVIIPAGIYWDLLALHKLPNEHLIKYILRVWNFRVSEWDIGMIVTHFEEGLTTDEEGRPVYSDPIVPPRPEGHHLDSLPTTPVWRSIELNNFPLLPIYSPRPDWNGIDFRHPREVAAEPPTYASLGDAIQPPAYVGQVSRSNGGSIGSSVVDVDNVRMELERLTANSTPSSSPWWPGEPAADYLDLGVSNPPYDALQIMLEAAATEPTPAIPRRNPLRWTIQEAPGEKHDYNTTEHKALPSYEEVVEWLYLPQLERQNADVASLEAMIQQEIERMDQIVDQLFIDYGDDAFQNPRTPPAVPGRSPTPDFTPLHSLMLSTADFAAFPPPPTSSDGHQWLEYMPPGTRLRGYNNSATDDWASGSGGLATIDDLKPRERQRWEEKARLSLHHSYQTLGNIAEWLSSRDNQEDQQGLPLSPTTAALAIEPMPPAMQGLTPSEWEEALATHAGSHSRPSSPVPDTLLPGSAPQPSEINLEPVVSRYSPTLSEESFPSYIDNAYDEGRRDGRQQNERQGHHDGPSEQIEYIAYQPANTPPRHSPVAADLDQYNPNSPQHPRAGIPNVPLPPQRALATYANGLTRARELLTVATWLEVEMSQGSLLSSSTIATIDSLYVMVSELQDDLGFLD